MFPCLPILDSRHHLLADAVLSPNDSDASWIDNNVRCLNIGQFGPSVHSAFWRFAALFFIPVGGIIFVRTQEQVRGIYTGRNIAGMANKHSFRNWTVFQFPRESVRLDGGKLGTSEPMRHPVPFMVARSGPYLTARFGHSFAASLKYFKKVLLAVFHDTPIRMSECLSVSRVMARRGMHTVVPTLIV